MGISHPAMHWKGHMKKPCFPMGGMHPMPPRFLPFILLIPIASVISGIIGIMLVARMTKALETMAMTKALDDMEDQLSDGERADLEMRIRENLFA